MSDEGTTTRRWRVSGRVQGVSFRYTTREQATRLGIEDGWAHNLASGEVEVCVRGPTDAVAALGEWLWQGPALARVTAVRELPAPDDLPAGFHTT